MSAVVIHLWQSTLFAAAALLLTVMLRRNRAEVRYGVWLAASIKFLVPFSLLFGFGSRLHWSAPAPPAPVIDGIRVSLSPPIGEIAAGAVHSPADALPSVVAALWVCGSAFLFVRWYLRWRGLERVARRATPLRIDAPIPVLSARAPVEPGIFGIVRPVLLIPAGIRDRFSAEQWEAILAHELCHVRRRDNLTAAIHMLVEAVFWFHPVVWWIGSRLIEERERACDEYVLGSGRDPEMYASSILTVCRLYAGSPLSCAAGVTGADLKERVMAIMTGGLPLDLTGVRKAMLAVFAAAALAGPLWFGIVALPSLRAQTGIVPGLKFEVASIKPAGKSTGRSGFNFLRGGSFNAQAITARMLIAYAYDVQDTMLTGGPKWINSDAFDIIAKPDRDEASGAGANMTEDQRLRARMRALLADRFQLQTHIETRQERAYVLAVAKGGPKLTPSKNDAPPGLMRGQGTLTSRASEMYHLSTLLSHWLGAPVVDRTGIKGAFDYVLTFESSPDEPAGPGAPPPESFFSALQEQLGLKLEHTRTSVEALAIDRIEKPSAN